MKYALLRKATVAELGRELRQGIALESDEYLCLAVTPRPNEWVRTSQGYERVATVIHAPGAIALLLGDQL